MNDKLRSVQSGFQVFVAEGGESVGAVRGVGATNLDVYIENSGEFVVDGAAVVGVHDGKVILDVARVEPRLRHAIEHAHDREDEAPKR
jgi:hypothetical protein